MFKQKQIKNAKIDTLIGANTRINGDLEFAGGLHVDGYINGNVKAQPGADAFLSVSEQGCIEGSVIAFNVLLNGTVKGDIEAGDRVELGSKARVLGNVHYAVIETAVGAQINGKLIHRPNPQAAGADQAAGGAISAPALSEAGTEEGPEL
jgi:cytoskeletal protein CcmA (bactofilin family)